MSEFSEGVYEESVVQNIGTGSTARKQEIKNFYLVKQASAGMMRIQLMDMDDKPLPITEDIPVEEFRKRFKFRPDYFKSKKNPKDIKVDKAIAQAEAHAKRKEFNSAEFEYNKALRLDEENVRANFGVGKVYLATGELDKAENTFKKLAKIDAVFEPENKHIFNELGIELRRMKLYDQAIEYYLKALTIEQKDEHLYFNAARAFYEKGQLGASKKFLGKALSLNPKLADGHRLLQAIDKKGK